eukprot:651263_1
MSATPIGLFVISVINAFVVWWIIYQFFVRLICTSSELSTLDKHSTRSIRYTATVSVVMFAISHMTTIPTTIDMAFNPGISYVRYVNDLHFGQISLTSWFVGRWTMSAVFVSQLKHSFKDTQYSLSHNQLRYVYIMLILYWTPLIMVIITKTMIHMLTNHTTYQMEGTSLLVMFSAAISILNLWDLMFSCLLLYLFQKKLLRLIQAYYTSFHEYKKRQAVELQAQLKDVNGIALDVHVQSEEPTHSMVSFPSSDSHKSSVREQNVQQTVVCATYQAFISDSVECKDDAHGEVADVPIRRSDLEKQMAKYDKQFDGQKSELIHIMTQYTVLITMIFMPSSLCMVCLGMCVVFAPGSAFLRYLLWFIVCTNSV